MTSLTSLVIPIGDGYTEEPSLTPMDEFCRLATKYALCQDQLPEGVPTIGELKERFAMFDWCKDKASAAAFGYYAALEESHGKQKAATQSIGDRMVAAIVNSQETLEQPEETVEVVMGLIYEWLKSYFEYNGYTTHGQVQDILKKAFHLYVRRGLIS